MAKKLSGRRRSSALVNTYLQAAINLDRMDIVREIEMHEGMAWRYQHILECAVPKCRRYLLRKNIDPKDRLDPPVNQSH